MKRETPLLFFFLIFFFLPNLQAAELAPQGTWERKLQRGFLNTAFAPIEISQALSEESARREDWFNWTTGLGRGALFATLRALTGIYDIVTFPLPFPHDYEPISQPEFALGYLGFLKDKEESASSPS